MALSFRPEGGRWLDLDRMALRDYSVALDLRRGLLRRGLWVRDEAGRERRPTSPTSRGTQLLARVGDDLLAEQALALYGRSAWSSRTRARSPGRLLRARDLLP